MIDRPTIHDSVILDHCHLERADRLEDSVLGRGVIIKKSGHGPKALRVFVSGDPEITQ